jgi:O-antigen ligase
LRRYIVVILPVGAVAVIAALFLIPGLHERVDQRVNDQRTTWDRKNLNRAAENMVLARPLLGFGWGTFQARSGPYFEQSPDYPLTNTTGEVHNVFLSNAAELGLVGTSLWLLALVLGVGGAIFVRGPPELYPWRIGLLAITVMWLIVCNLIPMVQAFPNQVLWLWAGVVWPWRYAWDGAAAAAQPAETTGG